MIKITDLIEVMSIYKEYDHVISIIDPFYKFKLKAKSHIKVRFYDTVNPEEQELRKMTRGVHDILYWTKNISPEDKILVHCHAGVSRSSAIAWLIKIQQGCEPKQAFEELYVSRPYIWPNYMVMKIGATFLRLGPEERKIIEATLRQVASRQMELIGWFI